MAPNTKQGTLHSLWLFHFECFANREWTRTRFGGDDEILKVKIARTCWRCCAKELGMMEMLGRHTLDGHLLYWILSLLRNALRSHRLAIPRNRIAFQDPRRLTIFVCTGTRPAARANAAAKAVVKGSSVRLSVPISVTEPNEPKGVKSNRLRTEVLTCPGTIASQVPQGSHLDHLPPPEDPPALAVAQVPPCVDSPCSSARRRQDHPLPSEHRERHEED